MFVLGGTASAASCGDVKDVYIRGGESHYSVDCFGHNSRVSGTVKDTRADKQCVQVRVVFADGAKYSPRACPSGTVKHFDLSGSGNRPHVYTRYG